MKKILLCVLFTLGLISCSDRGESIVPQSDIFEKKNNSYQKKPEVGVLASFSFIPGRKSKKCNGFGICELVAFGFTIIELPPKPEELKANVYESDDGNYFAELILNELYDSEDTTFYVDEEILASDENANQYIIKAGNYVLDSSMGEYGGYSIDIEKL